VGFQQLLKAYPVFCVCRASFDGKHPMRIPKGWSIHYQTSLCPLPLINIGSLDVVRAPQTHCVTPGMVHILALMQRSTRVGFALRQAWYADLGTPVDRLLPAGELST
jgi:hypothetical protein